MTAAPVRLLLLEERAGDAGLVRAALSEYAPGEFAITWVDRLATALTRIGSEHFDVALSDLDVPDSSGLATVQAIIARAPDLPLVVLTGPQDDALVRAAIQHGAKEFLAKENLSGALMARALRYSIERARLERRLHDANAALELRVTERTAELDAANRVLQASVERYRAVTETAADAIVSSDSAGNIIGWNAAAERMFGYTEAEVLGTPLQRLMPQRYTDDHRDGMRSAQSEGPGHTTGRPVELQGVTKAGAEFPIELSRSLWQTSEGTFFTAIIRDLTERTRAALALRDSESRVAAVFHASPMGVTVSRIDDGTILEINDAALHLFGAPRDAVIGRTMAELGFYAIPAQREALVARLHEQGQVERFEIDFRSLDDAVGTLELTGRLIDLHGDPCLVAMMMDVTERRRLERVHRQAQKLESLGALAAGVAHEFNNILAVIGGNADLAAEDVGTGHIAAESLGEIRKATARASELVRRLMGFGRPVETEKHLVELGAVVGEVLRILRSTLPAGIAMRMEFSAASCLVMADARQIHEAIVNLTTNAARAIGNRTGSIEYRLDPVQVDDALARRVPGLMPGRYARLTVCDSGCGIAPATLERIFDALFTTKPSGEGSGLGLSMVHGTMRSHGGAVTVESAMGEGAKFALYFPTAAATATTEAHDAPTPSCFVARPRVLYVDDEEALVFLADRVLSRLGYKVNGFTNPDDAVAAFGAQPNEFDIVVTDLSMPRLSGLDVAREVLAIRAGTPIVMTSGYLSAEEADNARAAGVREIILKPVVMDDLNRVLGRLFRESQSGE